MRRVEFIGLVTIGKPIATNVIQAGFGLMFYDLRKEPVRELAVAHGSTQQLLAKIVGYEK
jgi:3-hydroxyisobutyrate dehydrogenase-like beta-hydroxyacid dehydrogenase